MSLLSEDVSNVAQSEQVQINGLTIVAPSPSEHFSLLTGFFKQKVGYVVPRDSEYSFVLDITTGEPLQLPEGNLPTMVLYTPIQKVPSDTQLYAYLVDDLNLDNANFILNDYMFADRINYSYCNYFAEYTYDPVSGVDTAGYNWMVFYNDNYPNPVTAGAIKVVIAYQ